MTIGTMLSDILRALLQRPVTEKYPFERREAPERLRGKLYWHPEACTGCCLCSKDCPSNALEVITLDKKARRFVLRYHIDRCTYCAQCVQNCRFGCLGMSNQEWELAATSRDAFTVYYGDESDIEAILAGSVGGSADTPE